MKKYIIMERDPLKLPNGTLLYRIKSLREIRPAGGHIIPAHAMGGYVQAEKNLSQEGECWITDEAMALGKANVSGNALLKNEAVACNRAQVSGNAVLSGDTVLRDCAKASGNAVIHDRELSGIEHDRGVEEAA